METPFNESEFQDHFAREIAGREIRRHPLQPGKCLYAYGSLLLEVGRVDEAVRVLEELLAFDPVSPRYLLELGEAYKRIGDLEQANNAIRWAFRCAANDAELARCYRALAFCLSEAGAYADAAALYWLSLDRQPSAHAETELAWISMRTGTPVARPSERELVECCARLEVPMELDQTVLEDLKLL